VVRVGSTKPVIMCEHVVVDKAEITKPTTPSKSSCVLSNTPAEGLIVIHDDLLEI
jgi:hypothetical protein